MSDNTTIPQPFDRSAMTSKWQSKRTDRKVYTTTESSDKPKYFALDMFPYPSGAGLHVGHPKGYIATDVISRKKHLEGYNVLHPMGFDSFGLPTENYAMKNKIHPSQATDENIATFIGQLKKIGFNYDRDRMVSTADPEFYKRTQRQFLQMYHHYFDHTDQKAKPISELRKILQGTNTSKKVLILDGFGGDGTSNWIPWLKKELQSQGYEVKNPNLPATKKDHCNAQENLDFVMKEFSQWIEEDTIIIGHSAGCSLALGLVQNLLHNVKLIFVAPTYYEMDGQFAISNAPRFEQYEKLLQPYRDFFLPKYDILHNNIKSFDIILSDNDLYIPYNEANQYFSEYFPEANIVTVHKGHCNYEAGCDSLPEIMDCFVPSNDTNSPTHEITNFQNRYQTQTKSDPQFFASLTEEEKIEYYLDTEKRIAYISTAPINRCPSCMTALANEDLDGNNCERCGSVIERKKMRQWMIRITDYAQRLLDGLDLLPDRQDNIKAMQRHWIGKSEGTIIEFETAHNHTKIPVYTTRIDTIFGVTYVAIAPEYPDIEQYITPDQRATVLAYIEESKNKTDLQRQESKEKTGVRTGSYVINPFNNEQIPLRVADYVLMDYGTGAVMAVPAHDERDREFAYKYDLPIKEVIAKEYRGEGTSAPKEGIETLYRKTIDAIIENDRGEFLIMTEENPIKSHFVGGGIDEGDSELETVKKEIIEETGYTDFKIIGPITGTYIHMVGYRHTKNKNQNTVGRFFHVKLNSDNKIHSEVDDGKHTIKWLPIEAVKESINRQHHQYAYEVFLSKGKVMTEKGTLTNSGEFDGLTSEDAISAMQSRLAERGLGGKKTNYRLNNRVFSRQRYRGEPIPFVYKENQDTSSSLGDPIFIHAKLGKNLILDESKHRTLVDMYSHSDDDCIDIVGALIKDNTGAYYLHHKVKENYFLLPGGKVEKGESYEQAMIRELKEEMNIDVVSLAHHASVKRVINNCKYNVHYMTITEYAGVVEHLEADTFDLVHAEILPSHNRLGHAIKIDSIITDDEMDIMHAFGDLALTVLQTPSLSQTIDSQATIMYPDHFDPSTLYYQYYDQSQKKYFFSSSSPSLLLPTSGGKGPQDTQANDSSSPERGARGGWIRVTPMDESELPLTLPDVAHYEPTGTEEGPLAKIESWINTTLEDGTPARRESNTMPGWAGSSRYRLRYMDPRNTQSMLSPEKEAYRGQVDLYVGGMEHACRHLIYARFWHKFLKDIGVVSTEEPFKKLVGVGLVLAEDGRKMSKRRGNVINPDDVIAEFGTDAFRTYEMFMGPFGSEVARSTAGVKGVRKFLDKIIKLSEKCPPTPRSGGLSQGTDIQGQEPSSGTEGIREAGLRVAQPGGAHKKSLTLLHKTIKKVTEDIDDFAFNTAISALMIYVNHLEETYGGEKSSGTEDLGGELFESLIQLIAPFAPHLAEELRERLGHTTMLYEAKNWPSYDPALLVDDVITMGVQFNGKMKGTIEIAPTATQDEALALVHADAKLASNLSEEIKKIIYVPGRILNIVVG